MKLIPVLALSVLLVVPLAFAQDDNADADGAEGDAPPADDVDGMMYDENLHPLTDMPEASPDVQVVGLLNPSVSIDAVLSQKVVHGTEVTAIVGVVNNGQDPINVTSIMGSLNNNEDFGYYLHNFTQTEYSAWLEEGEEVSIGYTFKTAGNLDPVKYTVALTAFYENEEELFSHTFFNETMEFLEAPTDFNIDLTVLLLVVVIIGSGYFVVEKFGATPGSAAVSRIMKSKPTTGSSDSLTAVPKKLADDGRRRRVGKGKKKSSSRQKQ